VKTWEEECRRIRAEFKQKKEQADREYEDQTQAIIRLWEAGNAVSFEVQGHPLNQPSQAREGALDEYLRSRIQTTLSDMPELMISLFPKSRGLCIPDFEHPYTPDIPIRVSKAGKELFIDVENDEPWYRSNGGRVPHHASDDPKQRSRDHFFRDRGWLMIRFSEQQIANQTEQCVTFISDVIRSVYRPGSEVFKNPPTDHCRWDSLNALEQRRPQL
jgi:hypothetical protein